jgi:hypothetical protein
MSIKVGFDCPVCGGKHKTSVCHKGKIHVCSAAGHRRQKVKVFPSGFAIEVDLLGSVGRLISGDPIERRKRMPLMRPLDRNFVVASAL